MALSLLTYNLCHPCSRGGLWSLYSWIYICFWKVVMSLLMGFWPMQNSSGTVYHFSILMVVCVIVFNLASSVVFHGPNHHLMSQCVFWGRLVFLQHAQCVKALSLREHAVVARLFAVLWFFWSPCLPKMGIFSWQMVTLSKALGYSVVKLSAFGINFPFSAACWQAVS